MTRTVKWLIIATAAAFIGQLLMDRATNDQFTGLFSLHVIGFIRGDWWEFVTYLFLHGSMLHLVLNMMSLYLIGPELERSMGPKHFLILYFLSGILGGAGWLAITYPQEGYCVGASGAIFGILGAFAALFPNAQIVLLPLFIPMRAWIFVLIMLFMQLVLFLSPGAGGVAYMAHLGGALAGYVYALVVFRPAHAGEAWNQAAGSWRNFRSKRREEAESAQSVEVDRILDKIANEGIHTLTALERRQLEKASRNRASRT